MFTQVVSNQQWYKKIEILRVVYGLNQKEAAEKCLTDQKVYWLWEKVINYPRRCSRKAIADAYDMKIEDIFSVDDKKISRS